jgi:hypothetical protein
MSLIKVRKLEVFVATLYAAVAMVGGLVAMIFVAPYSSLAALFAAPSLGSLFALFAAILIVASHRPVARTIDLP